LRIAYCSNVRLPSERAHGHQVAQVIGALFNLKHQVTVFAPFRKNISRKDFWDYYRLPRDIKIEYFGTFDPIASPFLPGVTGLLWMNAVIRSGIKAQVTPVAFDMAYTRTPALLPALIDTGVPVILELHRLPRFNRRRFVKLCNRCALVVSLTGAMDQILKSWGVEETRIMVSGDAVDLRRFQSMPSSVQARLRFGIETDRPVVGYVGRLKTLGMEKGVLDLLKAVGADRKFFAFIVGGPEADKKYYSSKAVELGLTAEDVKFTGEIDALSVPDALAACDILAMPFPDLPHYREFMSPLKMFEYMASGKPIVSSDLPTVRDVLSEETAFFCEPGNFGSLLQRLREIVKRPEEARRRAENTRKLVEEFTWEKRMRRIIDRSGLDLSM